MTDYMEKLKQLAKHSIQLSIGGEETYRPGATRFGGRPDVPSDFVWPTFKGERYDGVIKNRPLSFLAQFNCAETAAHVIAMSVLVLNLRKIQRALLLLFAALLAVWRPQRKLAIVQ